VIRVLTNERWFDGQRFDGLRVEVRPVPERGVWNVVRELLGARRPHVVVLSGAPRTLLLLCLLKRLLPFSRWKLVSVDLVPRPRSTLVQRARAQLIRFLFGAVDLFIVFCRDASGMQQVYGIPSERICYVPFKINGYPDVLAAPVRDDGYILACGRTYRDYRTFGKAMQGLPYAAFVLTQPAELSYHGGDLDLAALPANVTLVRHDGAQSSWNDWIARAKFVVLPILPSVLNPAGISVYLLSMALGKCVIITEGPATRGMLDDGQAVIVPPGDPTALRDAIVRVSELPVYRAHVARAGREYALSLGGEDRLANDVVRVVMTRVLARAGSWAQERAAPAEG